MEDNRIGKSSGPGVQTSIVMMLLAFVAAVALTAWMRRYPGPVSERALFWEIVVPWATVARFPGAFVGSWLGWVARHALGWFTAVMAGMTTVVILNFLQDQDPLALLIHLRTGLVPPAVMFGILAATIAESALSLLEMLLPKTLR